MKSRHAIWITISAAVWVVPVQAGFCPQTVDCNGTSVTDACEVMPFDGAALYIHQWNLGEGVDVGMIPEFKDPTTLTIEAWVLPECLMGTRMRILSSGNPGLAGFGFGTTSYSGALRFTAFGVADYDTDHEHLVELQWTHVALVLDGAGDMHWYIDGLFVETVAAVAAGLASDDTIYIGRNPDGTESWRGAIDEVRVWNVAREPHQIYANRYRILDGDEFGLVAYWRFDEGQGSVAQDHAGDHTGTLSPDAGWVVSTPDLNRDGIPDECQHLSCVSAAPCADHDEDGIRDDPCAWWRCATFWSSWSSCQKTDIPFGDVGGPNGDCTPDGVADAHDRYHITQCFLGHDGDPDNAHPCEPDAPRASNLDPAGPFGSCQPDGVCDGHDAFAVLRAFDGTTTCSCDGGPTPAMADDPPAVEPVEVALWTDTEWIEPGDTFEVSVELATGLTDLRGLQLHFNTIGGQRGRLEVVAIDMPVDGVFVPQWSAANVNNMQIPAGVDGAGYAVEPGILATVTLRATDDARGSFAVELLPYTRQAPEHRSVLFGTGAQQRYRIVRSAVARVEVDALRGTVKSRAFRD